MKALINLKNLDKPENPAETEFFDNGLDTFEAEHHLTNNFY